MVDSENNPEKVEQKGIIPENTPELNQIQYKQVLLEKDLKGWCRALILIGIISLLVPNFLSPVWGVILIILGILTFFIIEPAMYLVFSSIIIMLGISNSITSSVGWSIFSVIQIIIGFYIFKSYFNYKDYYNFIEKKTFKFMYLSLLMLLIALVCIALPFLYPLEKVANLPKMDTIMFLTSLYSLILGTSFGLASVFTEKALKPLSILIMLFNLLIFLFFIAVSVLGMVTHV